MTFDRINFSLFHVLPVRIFVFSKKNQREIGSWTSVHLLSFSLSSFLPVSSFFTSLQLHHPRGKSDYSDTFLKDSAKRDPCMNCCSAVSTDTRHFLTIGGPPRDCDLSRIPSLPDRSSPSTGPPCVPSHPHYDHTDLVRAVKQMSFS